MNNTEPTTSTVPAAEDRLAVAQQRLAAAELRAAGVPADLVDYLDLSRVLDDDGEVDGDRVTAPRDKYAALAPASARRMAPNAAQGSSARGSVSSAAGQMAVARQTGGTPAVLRLMARQALGIT